MAGIYIHIPFCKKKCIYCDFYSLPDLSKMHDYCTCIKNEFIARFNEIGDSSVKTIYIGGGTPSLIPSNLIEGIIECINEHTHTSIYPEFTIEVNPDDVNPNTIQHYKSIGINRISMGVQSFIDSELAFLRRRHDAYNALKAVDIIRNAGIENISLDLIYGIPGQSIISWKESLRIITSLNVPHISCYNLSYEEGTPLFALRKLGKIKECDEDLCLEMNDILIGTLKDNGYEHYEISNFAKDGHYSIHNSNYWNLTPYLGLGVSAHSFDGIIRKYNPYNINKYMDAISSSRCAFETETLSDSQRYDEYVMLSLRTMWGVSREYIHSHFSPAISNHFTANIMKFVGEGLICESADRLVLTEKGIPVSDMIIRELMFID